MSSPDEVKGCCAAAYGRDAVALILGESYHPGGLALTRRLGRALQLRPGTAVADLASGPGTTARLLAAEFGAHVDGVDLSGVAVARATAAAADAGMAARVRFHLGDAEALPLPDGCVDAAVCECAFCTFPDKATAAAEFARILRPGGRVGITDVTVTERGLPAELTDLAGWIACIADARPVDEYSRILAGAGLRTTLIETHDELVSRMIDQIQARIAVLRITAPQKLTAAGVDLERVEHYLGLVRAAVDDELIGYTLLVARKPGQEQA
ncbi:methyltransferase domain-containing protein [Rhodococcus ruber]|uniref:class I SAM-dependent methyltransferase n=1 Tax=Rhodococcus ruber TaxID=1830 RepID=UPI00177CED96|nr:methyltransferase domain-containing protein [Rhodococcus ruber]MBD8057160.1 methyltransferase domain-containing protein [Rhodococcus ruber]